jgi:Sec7-like guanine-nucleotide exchange factor
MDTERDTLSNHLRKQLTATTFRALTAETNEATYRYLLEKAVDIISKNLDRGNDTPIEVKSFMIRVSDAMLTKTVQQRDEDRANTEQGGAR